MRPEFVNGTSVSRVYESGGEAELLGVFQYEKDAEDFAGAKIEEDKRQDWKAMYILAFSLTGKVKLIRPATEGEG